MPYETKPATMIRFHVWSRYLSMPKRDYGFYTDAVPAFKDAIAVKREYPDARVFVEDYEDQELSEIVIPPAEEN